MKTFVDLDGVSTQLQEALYKTFVDMPIEELKILDWCTWEADLFLENKCRQAA